MKNKAQVFHFDLYGKRDFKYDFLTQNSINTIDWTELNPQEPELFFVPKDFDTKSEYEQGFAVNELFTLNNVGIVTARDAILINENKIELEKNVSEFYNIQTDKTKIKAISYRPFDEKFIYYDTKIVGRSREKVMQHFLKNENIGLVYKLGNAEENSVAAMVTDKITDFRSWSRSGMQGGDYVAPLYLYPETTDQLTTAVTREHAPLPLERVPNLNPEIVQQIAAGLGIPTMLPSGEAPLGGLGALDILDYIYAVLHSPNYREKYKEFLKIDFPRVPYPTDLSTFEKLTNLGSQLRQIHLLESPIVEKFITQYPIDGDNVVVKPRYELTTEHAPLLGKVYINDTQYFDNVPQIAWEFYIGGYQPAQKWLKDRKGRKLEFDDILHYQKIIVALTETDRIMREIDEIEIT